MITVRSHAQVFGQVSTGKTPKISATSVAGDVAVIIMANQHPSTTAVVPPGWTGQVSSNVATRSGYIAWRRITDPAQTQELDWLNSADVGEGARKVGTLVVLSGVEDVKTLTPWQTDVPQTGGTRLLFSQAHGAAASTAIDWTADNVFVPGDKLPNSSASWSSTRGALTASGIGNYPAPIGSGFFNPQAWCGLELKQTGGEFLRANVMPFGATPSTKLKMTPNFNVAHRGGSMSWVEHTKKAYTGAVEFGCDALEFSGAKTRDNVWIGNHDQDFKRLCGLETPISNMTWQQIQDQVPAHIVPATLEWLLNTYGKTHTILFDPKNGAWLGHDDVLELFAPYKDNIILKANASAVTWLFPQWKEKGFQTWAYVYPSEVNEAWYSDLLYGPSVDYISMDLSATEEQWATLKATGKTIVSHILQNAGHLTISNNAGVQGRMVANISVVSESKMN